VSTHQPSRARRKPSSGEIADERSHFFGRRRFELARDLLCTLDFSGFFRDVNSAWERTLGYTREELLTHRADEFVHPDDWASTLAEAERLADGGEPAEFENRYCRKDGTWCCLEWWAVAAPHEGLIYASARDISARKQREAELEMAALRDPLTGLENRRGFEAALMRELASARRSGRCPGLVLVDLDRFKSINDRLGHQAGDKLLILTAATLVTTLRQSDLAARIGGDEFAVLLPDCDPRTAELVAGKIIKALRAQQLRTEAGAIAVSASAGVALLGHSDVETGDELMRAADAAMYQAKQRRSSFVVHGDAATAG
jgi:diguanylate cyclase (GGDEF)-like protein/PAS domain S-box-containing protein